MSWESGVGSRELSPNSKLYHYDLYRFEEGASSTGSELRDFASIGFEETLEDPEAINVVEWADRLGEFILSYYISVKLKGSGEEREIDIHFTSPSIIPETMVELFYDDWITPVHIRAHCRAVTSVAMQIAKAFMTEGIIINTDLLYTAGLLHDVSRVCDFKELVRDRFDEEVTDEKWERWTSLRTTYKGVHHADVAAKYLNEKGFTETAEVIRMHKSTNIVDEPEGYDTLEKKILYYADKRVKHTEVVDLQERFRDGKERYGKFNSAEDQELFDAVEPKTLELEKELFGQLDIEPSDIK